MNKYIYQLHKQYGQWEDYVDAIVGTFYSLENCEAYKAKLKAEYDKEYAQYIKCSECDYNESCFQPFNDDDYELCKNDYGIMWDENATFEIKRVEMMDCEDEYETE